MLYELMLVLDSEADEGNLEKTLDRVRQTLAASGELVQEDAWGRKRLAYEIKGRKHGNYYLFHFEGGPATTAQLEQGFHLDETVLRYLTVKTEREQIPAGVAGSPEVSEAPPSGEAVEPTPLVEEVPPEPVSVEEPIPGPVAIEEPTPEPVAIEEPAEVGVVEVGEASSETIAEPEAAMPPAEEDIGQAPDEERPLENVSVSAPELESGVEETLPSEPAESEPESLGTPLTGNLAEEEVLTGEESGEATVPENEPEEDDVG